MPELPEVETMRRGIVPIVGNRIARIECPACRKRPILLEPKLAQWRRRIVGRTITGIGRVGKRVVVELETGDRIVFEPRMTGLVLVSEPPTREHLRLRIALQGGGPVELLYWDRRGLGSARLLTPDEFAEMYGGGRLGPDALDVSAQELRARLARSRRPIKVALLDQRAVAGIGNLYASEILHACGIHPARPACSLRRREWESLHAAMRKVLMAAIRYEGSTLGDGTYRNALNENGSYQNQHRVYDKAGQLCRNCGRGIITRVVMAQRSTFYCPVCQPFVSRGGPRSGGRRWRF
jgi:formamidopyrimidine-DNA glycosylase